MTTVAGVDWAGTGWFAVVLNADVLDPDGLGANGDASSSQENVVLERALDAGTDVYPSLLNVVHETGADPVLVDIPIGLSDDGQRACDAAAREVLASDRTGSVFPTPCREAVYAPSYEAAKAVNEARTGRSVTVQTWNVVPRIREADALLAAVPAAREVVRESHPEVCFAALADEPVAHSKTTDEGVAERLSALETVAPGLPGLYDALVERFVTEPAPHARRLPADAADDVLDALALAATALVGTGVEATGRTRAETPTETKGEATRKRSTEATNRATSWSLATLPADPPTDEWGLPMEMVYPERA